MNTNTLDNYMNAVTPQKEVKAYGDKELDQNDFMTLLSAQLQHQDPMKPMENGEFIAEMAQFSALEESKSLTKAFHELSNTMMSSASLQASLLVGKGVSYTSNQLSLEESGSKITINNPVSGTLDIELFNMSGESVFKDNVPDSVGKINYTWNGEGGTIGEDYIIKVTNSSMEGQDLITEVSSQVKSVDISGSEIQIKLKNNQVIYQQDLIEIIDKESI